MYGKPRRCPDEQRPIPRYQRCQRRARSCVGSHGHHAREPCLDRSKAPSRQGLQRSAADLRSLSLMVLMMAARCKEARRVLCTSSGARTRFHEVAFPQVRDTMWSGAGSNCRPSAFQVNRAKRCANLQKRTSLTSGTALGGRCNVHASRTQNTPSTRQDNDPTQDHRDRRWRDHGRHPVGARRRPVRTVPTPRATRRIPASQRPSGERRQLARQITPQ